MKGTPCVIDALKRKAEMPTSEPVCVGRAKWKASTKERAEVEYV